jgi:hypothetical protein
LVDPWKGIRRGDRFYRVHKTAEYQVRYIVTDTWFDPVRGQNKPQRGYMVALVMADRHWQPIGGKWPYAASTVAGKSYIRAEVLEARAEAFAARVVSILGG